MKKFLPVLILFSSLFICTCTTGLGEEVDLEAPELTIDSPEKLSYSGLEIRLEGTCTDNKGIINVAVSNKETGEFYGYADVENDTWSFDITLPKEAEGEITFLVTANDAFGNSSTKSARTITLLVDEHAPEGFAWYVDRGNAIRTPLKEKEFLENLDLNLAVNKDYPQNEEFTIYGSFYDAMSISTITLKLYDVVDEASFNIDNPLIEKTVKAVPGENYIGDGKSIYSPSFTFTNSELAAKGLSTGKHYLRVAYYAKDNDEHPNEITNDTGLYVFWYPESDVPGIQQIEIENGKLSASIGSSIPIDFFDDDGLKEIKYSLRNLQSCTETYVKNNFADIFTEKKVNDVVTEPAGSNSFSNSTTRDVPVQIKAPELPGQMMLITYAKDIRNKEKIRIIPTEITDSQKPLLFIESPSENTIPEMKSGSSDIFQIKGYSLDSKGSQYVAVIYNPEGSGKQEEAQKFVDDNRVTLKTNKKYVDSSTKKVCWYYEFNQNNFTNGWNQQSFEIDMNILQDFKTKDGASAASERKFFEILLMDNDNNVVYKSFAINGDSTQPVINIKTPSKELEVHDFTQKDLVIEFKGEKNSKLGMNPDLYKVTTKIGEQSYTYDKNSSTKLVVTADGYAKVTIPKATLKTWAETEAQPTFTFYATDVLGNGGKGEGQRSIILSPRPTISSITVDKNSGTYKKGDVLKFKVAFSKQVKVTGTPKLKIKYSSTDSTPKYINYTEGSGSNALIFTYTVPEDAVSDGIICEGFDIESENKFPSGIKIQATELGEGDIYTALPAGEVLKGKIIKLDGKAPVINKITVQNPDGTGSYTKDKQLVAVVEMSEAVLVSGSPELVLKVDSKDVKFSFQKMNGSEIYFVHTITNTDPQGELKYNKQVVFTSAHVNYITDKTGNTLSLSATGSVNTGIYIDYTAPTTQPTTNLTKDVYNEAQTITLSNYEEGGTAYYSINGGVSWKVYDESNKEIIGNGIYKIVTRQADKAGNMSANSATKTVYINNVFAPVTGFSIDLGDGHYKAGTKFTFTLDFDEAITVKQATDIQLVFVSNKDSSKQRTINTKTISNETTSVKFEYTVTGEDFFDGVKVKEIKFAEGFKDAYGNKPAFAGTPSSLTPTNCALLNNKDGGNRESIVLDGVVPAITAKTPNNNGISTIKDNSKFKVTLTFAEYVYVEEGNIILQRSGNWAIPPVFDKNEFMSLYNKMTAANREFMMITKSKNGQGNEETDEKTGMPIGPYQKITHGLKLSGSNVVPDTETKFVLDFQYGLYDDNTTVNNIRNALKSIDYDRHVVDVTSQGVNLTYNANGTTTVEISFTDVIEDGRLWDLIIPPTAFRDNSENFYKGMNLDKLRDTEKTSMGISAAQASASEQYSLWSNNVAKPVVRVDRYSHGWGAKEPYQENETWKIREITVGDPALSNTLSNNSGRKIAPTGYARVRVDCETPGAVINYKVISQTAQTVSSSLTTNAKFAVANGRKGDNAGKITNIADIAKNSLEYTTGGQTYSGYVYIGDGQYNTARKDYVSAKATKTGFDNSGYGYEGVFKTVIYTNIKNNNGHINIEGGTAPGGEPSVSGFPLRDGGDRSIPTPYSKNSYDKDNSNHYWVSYEIVSTDFAILLVRNGSSAAYPLCSYGQGIYINNVAGENDF